MKLGEPVLVKHRGGIMIGVVVKQSTEILTGGEERETFVVVVPDEMGGEEGVHVVESEICEIQYYNAGEQTSFLHEVGGMKWAKERANELRPKPTPVRTSELTVQEVTAREPTEPKDIF